jgi:hypothetical protein
MKQIKVLQTPVMANIDMFMPHKHTLAFLQQEHEKQKQLYCAMNEHVKISWLLRQLQYFYNSNFRYLTSEIKAAAQYQSMLNELTTYFNSTVPNKPLTTFFPYSVSNSIQLTSTYKTNEAVLKKTCKCEFIKYDTIVSICQKYIPAYYYDIEMKDYKFVFINEVYTREEQRLIKSSFRYKSFFFMYKEKIQYFLRTIITIIHPNYTVKVPTKYFKRVLDENIKFENEVQQKYGSVYLKHKNKYVPTLNKIERQKYIHKILDTNNIRPFKRLEALHKTIIGDQ